MSKHKGVLVKLEVGGKEIMFSDMVPNVEYNAIYDLDLQEFLHNVPKYGRISFTGTWFPTIFTFIEYIQIAVVTLKECFSNYKNINIIYEDYKIYISVDLIGTCRCIFNEYQMFNSEIVERIPCFISDRIILDYNIIGDLNE